MSLEVHHQRYDKTRRSGIGVELAAGYYLCPPGHGEFGLIDPIRFRFTTEADAIAAIPAAEQYLAEREAVKAAKAFEAQEAARYEAAQKAAAPAPTSATPRQVNYIADLLVKQARSGAGDGFFSTSGYLTDDGSINLAALGALTRAEASALIDSLRSDY